MLTEAELDIRYENLYGTRAGFLPRERKSISPWNLAIKSAAANQPESYRNSPAILELESLFRDDGIVRMLVNEMIEEVPDNHRTVEDIPELLNQLNHITHITPEWEQNESKRHFFPMSNLFTYMMMTDSGEAVFRNQRFNNALRQILRTWCKHLDSSASRSVLNTGVNGWLSGPAQIYTHIDEFVIPDQSAQYWGFSCYNAFFQREIKKTARPIADPNDARVVVSPNDGTIYKVVRDVALETTFWIKSQPYSVRDMLAGHSLSSSFQGGDVMQSYLSGPDYHRWHAPVSGRILSIDIVEGLMFSNLASEGNDIKGTGSQGYYTSVNTRGLCFIEADYKPLGIVCVMPVGITEISSIQHTVAKNQHVDKGQEIGRFAYGGSSLATLFQPGAIDYYTVSVPNNPGKKGEVKVNAAIAVASSANKALSRHAQLELTE